MENRMEPLRCGECAAQVLVRKNSWEHTSIQWNTDARRRCRIEQDGGREGRPGAPRMSCSYLDETISRAATSGVIEVFDDTPICAPIVQ
ncbi:hypothetical protein HNC20_10600 [Rhodococcus rhodochrous]|uniref:Putative ferredoxin n=2 Tax=Rhodococcus rhodochrous TaxID=1829 RepID=F1CMX1_RHORH|nr:MULTISPECIES: hypothetical protein [unclassified Rhodococcus (in: high G+C Gram-positive bacteria)]ADY18311.1 putative ferredoxin [Rhodococcus rhodochrous]MDJ0399314.1 hypothetical protein [Rhodococcus rhodochrous]MDO1484392.1 hypothetical protein [Rhodococcus rhodochrous]WSE23277.1 hypothetical protein U9J23_02915 [Rhodococcus sp. PD04]